MGYLSTIYDVTNRAAVAFKLDQSCDERAALIALSDYFQPKDILLVDAGYYSSPLYNHFKSIGVELLCNLSASNKHIMSLEGDDIDFSHDEVSARKIVIRYQC